MSFWQFGITDGLDDDALERYFSTPIAPIGVEQVTIVGIVKLADEVLPEELYPRQRAIVSPDLAARYDCLPPEPAPGLTLAEFVAIVIPTECAFAQHYFSVSFTHGAADVKPALDEFVRISSERNEAIAQGITDLGQVQGEPPQYFLIPNETGLDVDRGGPCRAADGGRAAGARRARGCHHRRARGAGGVARGAAQPWRPAPVARARRRLVDSCSGGV